jgi:putative phosphoesterase
MRVAVISDMHGNGIALDAVLADLQRSPADQVVCLGDAIQGGPQPAQVVQRLRDLACPVVMGNADAFLLDAQDTRLAESASAEQLAVRAWSLAQLSAADQAFIAAFQPTVEVPLAGGRTLLCFHGSPRSFDEIILPTTPLEEVTQYLGDFSGAVLTGGHTHMQQIRRWGALFFFNPGSVGFAYSHDQPDDHFRADPWAEYAILTAEDDGRLALEFRRVPFDVAALIQAYETSGRPHIDQALAFYQP